MEKKKNTLSESLKNMHQTDKPSNQKVGNLNQSEHNNTLR